MKKLLPSQPRPLAKRRRSCPQVRPTHSQCTYQRYSPRFRPSLIRPTPLHHDATAAGWCHYSAVPHPRRPDLRGVHASAPSDAAGLSTSVLERGGASGYRSEGAAIWRNPAWFQGGQNADREYGHRPMCPHTLSLTRLRFQLHRTEWQPSLHLPACPPIPLSLLTLLSSGPPSLPEAGGQGAARRHLPAGDQDVGQPRECMHLKPGCTPIGSYPL